VNFCIFVFLIANLIANLMSVGGCYDTQHADNRHTDTLHNGNQHNVLNSDTQQNIFTVALSVSVTVKMSH
jgi:hypothetical protein